MNPLLGLQHPPHDMLTPHESEVRKVKAKLVDPLKSVSMLVYVVYHEELPTEPSE